jgi:DNA-binding IclR family transcriptional regulator
LASNQELLDFIRDTVRSVWALEILLVLRRDRARAWKPQEIVDELRASLPLVAGNLTIFETAGLVLRDGEGFRYAPASPWLESLCSELASAYRERPVTVINAIVSSSGDNLRTLADAFRLKGDK